MTAEHGKKGSQGDAGFFTRAVHSGHGPDEGTGALQVPIYQTSTFVFPDVDEGAARFAGESDGYIYSRLGNPTTTALEIKLADLEGGDAACAFGSGMAATTAVFFTLASAGDHVISAGTIYGCTRSFLNGIFKRMGVDVTYVDCTKPEELEAAIRPNTRFYFFETPANPNLAMVDMEAVAEICRPRGVVTICDNTFMSPYCQRPLEWGIDIVVHSATKFICGHGDTLGGIVVGDDDFMAELKEQGLKDIGGMIGPFGAWLLLRGVKTLPLRMERHNANAMAVAEWLEAHPAVDRVYYPGLPSHPQHELAKRQMMHGFGAMIAFELKGGFDAGKSLMNQVDLCTLAVSLGDLETLIQHPASMTHSTFSEEDLATAGIDVGLVRLAIGIENPEDIIADLEQGLAK